MLAEAPAACAKMGSRENRSGGITWRIAGRTSTRSNRSSGRRSTSCGRCSWHGCSWSLHHAYERVEHTRRAFDAAGVHPDDCRELADLARFPFTTKADLREQYPFGMFAVPREEIVRIHASSGTTGPAHRRRLDG